MSDALSGVRFGPFRLDPGKRVLWREDALVHLPPKALDVLVALAEQAGDVVGKEELISRVWPDTFVEEANLSVNVSALRKALGAQADGSPFIETIPKRGYRLRGLATGGAETPRATVAVLPFRVLGGGPDDQYLGLGLTDALITRLSRAPELAVRPTRSVLRHADADDPRLAGRALQVQRVVDGTVQCAGSRLRLTLQLLDVERPRVAWSSVLEEEASRLFSLQDEAATQVAAALGVASVARPREEPAPGAYKAYVQGRYFFSRFTGPWLTRALAHFHESVEKDAGYAPPHAGLALLSLVFGFSGLVPPADAWSSAESSARQATALDPALADAHVALAYVRLFRDWDWAGAEDALRAAATAEPRAASPHEWMALFLLLDARGAEAARSLAHAQEIDPLSLVGAALLGLRAHLAGEAATAVDTCRRTIDLEPGHFLGHWGLGLALEQAGDLEGALVAHRRAYDLAEGALVMTPVLARTLALAGRSEEARALLREEGLSLYQRATVELTLGAPAAALALLSEACDGRDPWAVLLPTDRLLTPLHGTDGFRALLERVRPPARDARRA